MLGLNWLVPLLAICCVMFVRSLPTLSPEDQVNDCSATVIPKNCEDWTDKDCEDKCLRTDSNFISSCIWFDRDDDYVSCPWACKILETSDLCTLWCKKDKKCVGPTESPTTESNSTESNSTGSNSTGSNSAESNSTESTAKETTTDSAYGNGQHKSDDPVERTFTYAFVILLPCTIFFAVGFRWETIKERILRCVGKYKDERAVPRGQSTPDGRHHTNGYMPVPSGDEEAHHDPGTGTVNITVDGNVTFVPPATTASATATTAEVTLPSQPEISTSPSFVPMAAVASILSETALASPPSVETTPTVLPVVEPGSFAVNPVTPPGSSQEMPETPPEKPLEMLVTLPETPQEMLATPPEIPQEMPVTYPVASQEMSVTSPQTPQEMPVTSPETPLEFLVTSPRALQELAVTSSASPQEMPVTSPETLQERPVASQETPQEMPVTYPEAPQEMPVTYPEIPQEMPVASQETPQEMPVKPPETSQEMPVTSPETPQEMPVTSPETPQEMSATSLETPQEMSATSQETPQAILVTSPEVPQEIPVTSPETPPVTSADAKSFTPPTKTTEEDEKEHNSPDEESLNDKTTISISPPVEGKGLVNSVNSQRKSITLCGEKLKESISEYLETLAGSDCETTGPNEEDVVDDEQFDKPNTELPETWEEARRRAKETRKQNPRKSSGTANVIIRDKKDKQV